MGPGETRLGNAKLAFLCGDGGSRLVGIGLGRIRFGVCRVQLRCRVVPLVGKFGVSDEIFTGDLGIGLGRLLGCLCLGHAIFLRGDVGHGRGFKRLLGSNLCARLSGSGFSLRQGGLGFGQPGVIVASLEHDQKIARLYGLIVCDGDLGDIALDLGGDRRDVGPDVSIVRADFETASVPPLNTLPEPEQHGQTGDSEHRIAADIDGFRRRKRFSRFIPGSRRIFHVFDGLNHFRNGRECLQGHLHTSSDCCTQPRQQV